MLGILGCLGYKKSGEDEVEGFASLGCHKGREPDSWVRCLRLWLCFPGESASKLSPVPTKVLTPSFLLPLAVPFTSAHQTKW